LAVGDAEFQKKAIGKMQDVSKGEGRTVLFVSHNMASVQMLCTRGIVLENGKIVFDGDVKESISYYTSNDKKLGGNLMSGLKYNHTSFKVAKISVNGRVTNEVNISPEANTVQICIEGSLDMEQHLDLEGRLYDQYGMLVGLWSPGHMRGQSQRYKKGEVHIDRTIAFPRNILKGDFRMELSVTHPNICSFVDLETPLIIHSSGFTALNGRTFSYSDCGLIILDSE